MSHGMCAAATNKYTAEGSSAGNGVVSSKRPLYDAVLNASMRTHLIASVLLRAALIAYGHVHDARSEVPYTDIDYTVVMDGARHVLAGRSPFERHAYRYSPLLAYLQLPSVLLHPTAGKWIYAAFDIFVAALIYALVRAELQRQYRKAVQSLLSRYGQARTHCQQARSPAADADARNRPERYARLAACVWLYNPLTAVISTRGNGDSFACFFVVLTLFLLARAEEADARGSARAPARWLVLAAGLTHGLAIHLRLYPVLFSLAYYLSLSERLMRSARDCLGQLLRPNGQQLLLVAGTALGLLAATGLCWHLYGWQYVFEAHLYHLVRRDARHNFSLYFLLQYLGAAADGGGGPSLAVRCLVAAPQFFLLLYVSLSFGQFRQTLPFCVFALAFVLVTFNTVVTSQYFVWYLSLLPLCLNNLHAVAGRRLVLLVVSWLLGQAGWLLPAYLLEFRTYNTFYWLGVQSAVFFVINGILLGTLIRHYSFASFKVNYKKLF